MDFTPIIPLESNGTIDSKLHEKANDVVVSSAKLTSGHNNQILSATKELLRTVNSYYSNKIESEGTHPIDIEKAMKKEFSKDSKKRELQFLSLAYIDTQKRIEELVQKDATEAYSLEALLMCHRLMYDRDEMKGFLKLHLNDKEIEMEPGKIRELDVIVGEHVAPSPSELNGMLNKLFYLYAESIKVGVPDSLIYAFSFHHRLMWVHPFLDGNGRTGRLLLDAVLHKIGLDGYGLWNISRGLARDEARYKELLKYADMQRQGDYDGRGNLSSHALKVFVEFMLDTAKDQIDFMNSCLRLDRLSLRIENYVRDSQSGYIDIKPLPKGSEKIFKELLLVGELKRGSVDGLLGVSRRTSTTIVKALLEGGYLESNSHNAPVRLKLNAHICQFLFPQLI